MTMRLVFEGEMEDVVASVQKAAVRLGGQPALGGRPIMEVLAEVSAEDLKVALDARLKGNGEVAQIVPLKRKPGRPKKKHGFESVLERLGLSMGDLPEPLVDDMTAPGVAEGSDECAALREALSRASAEDVRQLAMDRWALLQQRYGLATPDDLADAPREVVEMARRLRIENALETLARGPAEPAGEPVAETAGGLF